jgi:hypothetical protein
VRRIAGRPRTVTPVILYSVHLKGMRFTPFRIAVKQVDPTLPFRRRQESNAHRDGDSASLAGARGQVAGSVERWANASAHDVGDRPRKSRCAFAAGR